MGNIIYIQSCIKSNLPKYAPITPASIWMKIYKNAMWTGYLYVLLKILKSATAGLNKPPENCLPIAIDVNIEREKSTKK